MTWGGVYDFLLRVGPEFEKFDLEVIGILPNLIGPVPAQSIILIPVFLNGPHGDLTHGRGFFAGMSGKVRFCISIGKIWPGRANPRWNADNSSRKAAGGWRLRPSQDILFPCPGPEERIRRPAQQSGRRGRQLSGIAAAWWKPPLYCPSKMGNVLSRGCGIHLPNQWARVAGNFSGARFPEADCRRGETRWGGFSGIFPRRPSGMRS